MTMTATLKAVAQLTRLDKPVGTYLLLWPTLVALWLAAGGVPPIEILAAFVAGTFVMRAAGCVINDIADRHVDQHVERTRHRPLADGRLNVSTAWILFAILLCTAALIVWTLNPITRAVAVGGAVMAAIYPFLKRVTNLPQVALGLAFSWGIPMASTAINQGMTDTIWVLFLANFLWVIAYDTQYAMTDRNDDLQIGIGSTAILFGERDLLYIGLMQLSMLGLLVVVGVIGSLGVLYYVSLVAVAGLFVRQYRLTKDRNASHCFRAFLNNTHVGLVLFLGTLLGIHIAWP